MEANDDSSRKAYGRYKVTEPDQLLCPITHAMYRDPVFVPESGNTYEREAITKYWASALPPRDALTNTIITNKELHTNWGVRREVQCFLDAHPGYVPQGWPDRKVPVPAKAPGAGARTKSRETWLMLLGALLAVLAAYLFVVVRFGEVPPDSARHARSSGDVTFVDGAPKGSKIEALRYLGESLSVRLPAKGPSGDAVGQAFFACVWLFMTWTWTAGVVRGGAPLAGAFSLPFWGVGLTMVANFGGAFLASERLDMDQEQLTITTEVFGRDLGDFVGGIRLQIDFADLRGPPYLSCDSSQACALTFDEEDELVFGDGSILKRDEAKWLQRACKEHLIATATTSSAKRRFERERSRGDDNHKSRRQDRQASATSGFGGFGGFGMLGGFGMMAGPGFTFVIR